MDNGSAALVMEEEIWKPVLNWEDLYFVSSFGRVRRSNRILKGTTTHGYNITWLKRKSETRQVATHILVCEAFNGSRPFAASESVADRIDVNHKDGNKKNNHYYLS